MRKFEIVLFFIIVLSATVFGQSSLRVFPDTLKYTDTFERLQHLFIYNDGNEELTIDSIYIDESIYYPRFDRTPAFPITLQPSDSLVMDCIFWNYWGYTYGAYDSTVVIYSNSANNATAISSKINLVNTSPGYGKIEGTVTIGSSHVQNAKVLFYRNGIILTDSVSTNEEGYYSIDLLAGSYFAAVEKDGYVLSYNLNRISPVDADFINLNKDNDLTIDFKLTETSPTNFSIHGNIFDRLVNSLSKKKRSGIVVARRGDHNPSKISSTYGHDEKIYTGVILSDGSYSIKNIQESGYYYIQAFAEFYIPGYYAEFQNNALFWQDADSVYIDAELTKDYNIYLERDSSYGAGVISGKVSSSLDSNFKNTIVYAQAENGLIYTHNFVDRDGSYKITGLPYGRYEIIAQLIGYENAVSDFVKVSRDNFVISNVDLEFSTTNINEPNVIPSDFELYQNYPNPFNPETVISFSLNQNSFVILKVYDILGNEVAKLIDGMISAGSHKVRFTASDFTSKGRNLSGGVYFYSLRTPRYSSTKKMILLK